MKHITIALLVSFALSGGSQALAVDTSPDAEVRTIPEVLLESLQEDLALTEVQAAAIVGNLAHETGNFRHLQQIRGPSFGYSQWLGDRKQNFLVFARDFGGAHTHEANYAFLVHEIETEYDRMMNRIRNTDDVTVVAGIFMREFLRPNPAKANQPRRVNYARQYLAGDFSDAGCVGTEFVEGGRILPCPSQ